MKIINLLEKRRTIYNLNNNLPVEEKKIVKLIEKTAELVPDAYNMKSSRVVVAMGEKQNKFSDNIYDVFNGDVPREKIDSFKSAYGIILFFYDNEVVKSMQDKFPLYKDAFPKYAVQSAGMLQISIWSGLAELNIGASLQHYNPIIDNMVKELFNLPESYVLDAQMPFGGIVKPADVKEKEDISERVKFVR